MEFDGPEVKKAQHNGVYPKEERGVGGDLA